MMHRVRIEFVVDIPNADVANDVEVRLIREHHVRLCEFLKSVMGFEPLAMPSRPGVYVEHEPVTWDAKDLDWVGEDEDDDDDDEDEDDDDE